MRASAYGFEVLVKGLLEMSALVTGKFGCVWIEFDSGCGSVCLTWSTGLEETRDGQRRF